MSKDVIEGLKERLNEGLITLLTKLDNLTDKLFWPFLGIEIGLTITKMLLKSFVLTYN